MSGRAVTMLSVQPQHAPAEMNNGHHSSVERPRRPPGSKEGGAHGTARKHHRDGVFSLSRPVQSYANTLQVFDHPSANIFSKRKMSLEDSKPTAREIQLLLNNFKEEQVRLMKMQNQEFEKDKQ